MSRRGPLWIENFRRTWKRYAPLDPENFSPTRAGIALQKGIRALADAPIGPRPREALAGQPFDAHLLAASPLFRTSRKLFLKMGGTFTPSLLSSPRSLTSPNLIENHLEYSPIENEMLWLATDPIESKKVDGLLQLRTYSSSLFHEQNHRILWAHLPPPAAGRNSLRKYLNLCEAIVVTTDMTLGDELSHGFSEFFYLAGTTYDPGTDLKTVWRPSGREYRNYLQALLHATYLNLESYGSDGIKTLIPSMFPTLGKMAERAADRALRLDRLFVDFTNPEWQGRHAKKVLERKTLPPGRPKPIEIGDAPSDNRIAYLFFEKWLDLFGIAKGSA